MATGPSPPSRSKRRTSAAMSSASARGPVVVEGREGLERGPVVLAEELHEVLRRGEAEGVGPARGREVATRVAEELAHVLLGAPQRRRRQPGRGRDVRGDRGEQLADEAVRASSWPGRWSRPGRQTRRSSAAARSWSGANITPNDRHDRVEGGVGEGSASASPSTNSTSRPSARGPLARRGRAARGRSRSTTTSQPQRAAASAVLPLPPATSSTRQPGAQVGRVAQQLGDDRDPWRPTARVVAARPGLPAAGP